MDPVDAGIFEAWLASTDDGVVAVDGEGRVVLHNPAASRVTGLSPAAARHRPWREVLRLDRSVGDLLCHLPFRYEDRRQIKKISAGVRGEEASFIVISVGSTELY